MRWRLVVAVAVLALGALAGGAVAREIPAEEREDVQRRVEEMEAQMRRIRDEKLARCRGSWSACTNKKCKPIRQEDPRWQVCQNVCDEELSRCEGVAYEYWPKGE